MERDCERLRLTSPAKRSRRILYDIELRPTMALKWKDAYYEFRVFREAVEDAIEDCVFIAISEDKVKYTTEPDAVFSDLSSAFPIATEELRQAGRCLASGFDRACVSHCMNALEQGLRSLARIPEINATFKAEIEVENWKNIIDVIESNIRIETKRIEEKEPKGLEKLGKLKVHADTAMQFRYFKDAWRNHVSHGRENYDPHSAETILTHVTDFTRLLIQRGMSEA
jgi:hypothetical protein